MAQGDVCKAVLELSSVTRNTLKTAALVPRSSFCSIRSPAIHGWGFKANTQLFVAGRLRPFSLSIEL
jgi:hypothetical protein